MEHGRAGWAHSGHDPGWRTPTPGEQGAVLGEGQGGWAEPGVPPGAGEGLMEREAGVRGQGAGRGFPGELISPVKRCRKALKSRAPNPGSVVGGLVQAEGREWAGASGDPPPTMPLASPPQTGSGPAYQLSPATQATRVTPTPAPPLSSDYCCHFPGLGRTRDSFKNISFAK